MKNTDTLHKVSKNVTCPVTYHEILPENDSGFPAANEIPRYHGAGVDETRHRRCSATRWRTPITRTSMSRPTSCTAAKGDVCPMRNEDNNEMLMAINIRHYSIASVKGYSALTVTDTVS